MMEQAAQRSCGFPVPGSVQGHVGWDCDLTEMIREKKRHAQKYVTWHSLHN